MHYKSDSNKAIDVSHHNGVIDWSAVADNGYKAIVRCGYGDDHAYQDDRRWYENATGAAEQGCLMGVYIYSYAQSIEQVRSEAQHVLRCIGSLPFECRVPVFLDLEEWYENDKATWQRYNALVAAQTFSNIIAEAGYLPGVYASLEAWKNTGLVNYDAGLKWVAAWRALLDYECDIWQYTDSASVPGVPTRCDVNNVYLDFEVERPLIQSLDWMVARVLNNEFGTLEERKAHLGSDYQRVQNRVNEYYAMAERVYQGEFGNQPHRKPAVESLGYDYDIVQRIVNILVKQRY